MEATGEWDKARGPETQMFGDGWHKLCKIQRTARQRGPEPSTFVEGGRGLPGTTLVNQAWTGREGQASQGRPWAGRRTEKAEGSQGKITIAQKKLGLKGGEKMGRKKKGL